MLNRKEYSQRKLAQTIRSSATAQLLRENKEMVVAEMECSEP